MGLLFLILIFCSFSYQDPPPAPKKVILIELSEMSGGGGGGNQANSKTTSKASSTPQMATQNSEEAPSVISNPNPKPAANPTPVVNTPRPDENAIFRPGMGGGTGGGTGTGTGSGVGTGIGPGEGSGSGGGIGYGTGNRGMVRIPDMTIREDGVVYVEVHVNADGSVKEARILNTSKHPTSITSSAIRNECLNRAKNVKYVSGKEELRIIVFKP
jgi:hypothetical protein